jgi:hypothetical protein
MLDNAQHSILIMQQPLSHTFKEQQGVSCVPKKNAYLKHVNMRTMIKFSMLFGEMPVGHIE